MIPKGICPISCFFTTVYEAMISSMPRTLNTMAKNQRFLANIEGRQIETITIIWA